MTYRITTEATNLGTGPVRRTMTVVADEQWEAVERACAAHRALCTPYGVTVRPLTVEEVAPV